MRALEDALARIARRDELRERANGGRGGAHRIAEPPPAMADHAPTPSVSPVVDEVTEALQAVVRRNPGVFATVVVQDADTAWSVWIGEWDGTLRTRVTQLEPDPPALPPGESRYQVEPAPRPAPGPAVADVEPAPLVPAPATPPPAVPAPTLIAAAPAATASQPAPAATLIPAQRRSGPDRAAAPYQQTVQVNNAAPASAAPRQVNGPAMNDRVADRIAELLRREAARETHPAT